jgi:hypothetical protein
MRTILLSLMLLATPATRPAGGMPTMADLEAMYAAGDYRACVQSIAQVANTRGFDPKTLALLRAECLMGLKDKPEALRWYKIAADSPDATIAAKGRSGMLLVQAVGEGESYTPRQQRVPEPHPISTPDGRRQAMLALSQDMLAELNPKLEAAARAPTLAPLIELAPRLIDAAALELAATGKTAKIGPILTRQRDHALTLVEAALAEEQRVVQTIGDKADQMVQSVVGPYWWQQGTVRRGLYSDDRAALRRVLDYSQQIESFCDKARHAAVDLQRDPTPWVQACERARSVHSKAQAVLDRD